ncbi:unnamed protein product (macronuclear) [Paramecium tetraurelia]|uniref:Mini antigen n=1 Tax=Paramecium tetraurelia TaxID=5888 RepID=A0CGC6_PARTE|nr:uncharacterized protein GSPATT00007283001 [Paramecium tetraurelia]CAK69843.1 unnamed protein product [Paramecium tetraurelia]|eukprot:XP_001437240.1 hypothetical protein (macronuclear) [Paramecium tetraurelia strain d4-2]
MIYYYLIGFLLLVNGQSITTLSLSQFYQCTCENLKTPQDCFRDFCNWDIENEECQNKKCEEFTKGDCQAVPEPFNCVWNYTIGKCEDFKACSDFSFPASYADRCYELIKCQADPDSIDFISMNIKCMDRSNDSAKSIVNCDKIPYESCKWLVTDEDLLCVKNLQTKTCETRKINNCADYNTKQTCDKSTCYWDGSCKSLDCSKLSEENCQYYLSFDQKNVTLCTWKENQCSNLDIEKLKQNQCLSYTIYSYAWNPDSEKCEICKNQMFLLLSYGIILLFLGII